MTDKDKFTICIRSSGEFTANRLLKDITFQMGSDRKVYLIKDLMLYEAIEKSFEFALKDESEWLITLDADLVIFPNFLTILKKVANSMKPKEIEAHAMTIDRLFLGYRSAGNRLYRVSSIPVLQKLLKKTKNNIRPEGTMLRLAEEQGYKLKPIKDVVALHDFFQFSKDLIRKGYLCSFKHIEYSSKILSTWRKMENNCFDYSILLKGFALGLINGSEPQLDAHSEIFNVYYKNLSKEFSDYDQELVVPENLETYINQIKSYDLFNNAEPGLIKKSTNLLLRRIIGKK